MRENVRTFSVAMEAGSAYVSNPDAVRDRVLPHILQHSGKAVLEHNGGNAWTLHVPATDDVEFIISILEDHYGCEVTEN